jgi:hypothetical protein
MTDAVSKRLVALLRASARGQLLVLACAAVLLALPALGGGSVGGDTGARIAAELVVVLVAVGMSARVALRGERGYETTPSDLPGDVLALLPRLVVQCACTLVPFAVAWWLATAIGGAVDVLGLLLVPLVALASLLAPPLLVLVVAAAASGDPAWTPAAALRVATGRRGVGLALAWLLLLAAIALSLPVALGGFVAAAQVPHAGFLAFGVAGAVVVPVLGCGALALWRELGGTEVVVAGALERPDAASLFEAAVQVPGADEAWVDGPAWDVAIDAGTAWGTWLRLSTATRAAVRVTWSGGEGPGLSLSGTDGVWWRPGDPAASGAAVSVDLPAGDTYLQVESRSGVAQAVSVVLVLPAAAVA